MPNEKSHKQKRRASSIDVYIGKQIYKIRMLRGMTQNELAKSIDIQCQQLQKYETGMNRVSAGRMVEIAEVLNTTIPVLFGKYGTNRMDDSLFEDKQTLRMVRAYNGLPAALQGKFYGLVLEMGKQAREG